MCIRDRVISLLYKGDYYEHYLFISFWLLFMTGMRIGEAAALQWDDIDLFVELKHYHDYIYVIKQHGFEEVNTDYTTDGHTRCV